MPLYEHVYLARQDLATGQVEGMNEAFAKIVEEGGGQVIKTEYWGLRTIAYRIAKNRKAHYVLMNLDAPAPAVTELERQVALNEDVIRHMTVRVEELEAGPSAMVRRDRDREGRRGDRGERGGERGGRSDRGQSDEG